MTELQAASDRLVGLARQRKLTVVTVESCTAGALANVLSQAEGAAQTLQGGFVVYTKANKTAALGIPAELIARHTAVSAACSPGDGNRWITAHASRYRHGHYRSGRAETG